MHTQSRDPAYNTHPQSRDPAYNTHTQSQNCIRRVRMSNFGGLSVPVKGTVSRDFPAQTAYIIHLQITSLFMDKKDFASFCKLAEIFAYLSHSVLSGTALSARWALSRTGLSKTGRCPGLL